MKPLPRDLADCLPMCFSYDKLSPVAVVQLTERLDAVGIDYNVLESASVEEVVYTFGNEAFPEQYDISGPGLCRTTLLECRELIHKQYAASRKVSSSHSFGNGSLVTPSKEHVDWMKAINSGIRYAKRSRLAQDFQDGDPAAATSDLEEDYKVDIKKVLR